MFLRLKKCPMPQRQAPALDPQLIRVMDETTTAATSLLRAVSGQRGVDKMLNDALTRSPYSARYSTNK